MRNLKKVLSLALALVMLVGMMVVGAGATSFADDASIQNQEAVSVLAGLGVVKGRNDGSNFDPTGTLTRAEAAMMIAQLDLGVDAAAALTANGTNPFSDVAATHWAAGAIDYCAARGLIAGDGAGKFLPDQEVSGVGFALMVCRVLGYEDANEDVGGATWEVKAAALARKAGLTKDVTIGSQVITRDEMAQVAFNALTADMVEYSSSAITIGDLHIPAGKAKPVESDNTVKYDNATDNKVQLCEEKFPELEKVAGDVDGFGRPADYKWTYNDDSIYNAPKSATITFTAETSQDNVLKAIKGYKFGATTPVEVTSKSTQISNSGAAIGDLTFANASEAIVKAIADETGNGTLVEIFATDKVVDTVVIVNYTVGKVTNVSTNSKGNVTYTINGTQKTDYADDTDDTIAIYGSVEKDDVVLFTDRGTVRHVYPLDSFTGKMTRYSTANKTMTVNGDVYTTAAAGVGSSGLTAASAFTGTDESIFYVDQYGYIVAVDGISVDTNYAVIDSIAAVTGSGVNSSGYVEARLVFMDGSTEVVKVATGATKWIVAAGTNLSAYDDTPGAGGSALPSSAVADTTYTGYLSSGNSTTAVNIYCVGPTASVNDTYVGSIVKYTVSDDKYTLTDDGSVTAGTATFTKGNPTIGTLGGVTNNDTVYVVKTGSSAWTVYTGYRNMPSSTGTIKADYARDGGIVFVYVDATADGASVGSTSSEVVFFFNNNFETDKSNSSKTLYIYNAIRGGEVTEVIATANLGVTDNTLYKVTLNDDDQITAVAAASGADYVSVTANGNPAASKGVLTIDTSSNFNGNSGHDVTSLVYNDDSKIYYVDLENKGVTVANTMDDVRDNADIYVKTVEKSATSGDGITIDTAYVLVAEEAAPAALSVSTQPVSKKYFQGTTFDATNALSVAATGGTAGYTYQWQKSTTDTQDASFSDISGATGTTLTLDSAAAPQTTGNTYYRCKVTDSAGTPATVTSSVATIEVKACTISWPGDSSGSGDAAATEKKVTVTCSDATSIKAKSVTKSGTVDSSGLVSNVTVNSGDATTVYTIKASDDGTVIITLEIEGTGIEKATITHDLTVKCSG